MVFFEAFMGIFFIALGFLRLITAINFTFDDDYAEEAIENHPRAVHGLMKKGGMETKEIVKTSRTIGSIPSIIMGLILLVIGGVIIANI